MKFKHWKINFKNRLKTIKILIQIIKYFWMKMKNKNKKKMNYKENKFPKQKNLIKITSNCKLKLYKLLN